MALKPKTVSELLREVANRLDPNAEQLPENTTSQQATLVEASGPGSSQSSSTVPNANASNRHAEHATRNPVQAEVARLFAPYRTRPSSTSLSSLTPPSSKKKSYHFKYTHAFFCLSDHLSDTVPSKTVKYELAAAGLGERRISFQARDDDPHMFKTTIEENFPQLKDTGGFELLRISGSTRTRNLGLIPCPDTGYTVGYIRSPICGIGQATIYIRPLQKSIPVDDGSCILQQQGPLTKCLSCNTDIPLNKMKSHIIKCTSALSEAAPQLEAQARQTDSTIDIEVPSCSYSNAETPDVTILELETASVKTVHCSGELALVQEAAAQPEEEKSSAGETPEWKSEPDRAKAAWLYNSHLLSQYETRKAVVLQMDLRESMEDQERSLISCYKLPKVEWASPVCCKLEGDVAVGEGVKKFFFSKIMSLVQFGFHLNFGNTNVSRLFDGEPDHLTPSTSQTLLESDMFLVAGRMMGHSFLHGGPCLSGISTAIIHVLFGGSPETATIQIKDCPDVDIRTTIQLLEGTADLTEQEKASVLELALSWDLPGATQTNRKWLYERLLFHAVITRTSRQVKQLRKGLKETLVWPLLVERPDIIPLFLPRESETAPSCESILERIVWPAKELDDDDDEECSLEDQCRVAGFLRSFIENASCEQRKALLKFWTGWEVLPGEMSVEVVNSQSFPKSSTCFEVLRIPARYQNYESFFVDMQACLASIDTGFGLV